MKMKEKYLVLEISIHKCRKPISSERGQEVIRLAAEGTTPKARIARQVGIGEATVYRILKS